MYKYNHIVLGGTFDHFHQGHQALMSKAFQLGKKVTIGLAKENLYQDKFLSLTIEDYHKREKSVRQFLKKKGWLARANLIPIIDIYGTTLKDGSIEAIVVSWSTYKNALKIDKERVRKNLPPLEIEIVDNVLADDGELLTSERIRLGEIDRRGKNYYLAMIASKKVGSSLHATESNSLPIQGYKEKKLFLPESLQPHLRKPLGKVFKGAENALENTAKKIFRCIDKSKSPLVVAVGDIIVFSLLKLGFEPVINIVDFRSRRKPIEDLGGLFKKDDYNFFRQLINARQQKFFIKNEPGTINIKVTFLIKKAIDNFLYQKKKSWFIIDGEEDLLVLPVILLVPLNSLILYGQMDLGVVAITVDEKEKKKALEILKRFDSAYF